MIKNKTFIFIVLTLVFHSCTKISYLVIGVKKIEKIELENAHPKFVSKNLKSLNYDCIFSDSTTFSKFHSTIPDEFKKPFYQPIQLLYFQHDTLVSHHVNCNARGNGFTINWNTNNRFNQFVPAKANNVHGINITTIKKFYPEIKNDTNKTTIIIFWTNAFERHVKSALKTVAKNIYHFQQEQNIKIYLINIDDFYKSII